MKRLRPLAINYFVIRNILVRIKRRNKKKGMQFARPQNSRCLSTRMNTWIISCLFILFYFLYIIQRKRERDRWCGGRKLVVVLIFWEWIIETFPTYLFCFVLGNLYFNCVFVLFLYFSRVQKSFQASFHHTLHLHLYL